MEAPNVIGNLVKTRHAFNSVATESYTFDWVVTAEELCNMLHTRESLPVTTDDFNGNGSVSVLMKPKVWLPSPSARLGEHIGCPSEWCVQMTTSVGKGGLRNISLYVWLLNFLDEKGEAIVTDTGAGDGDEYVDVVYKLELFDTETESLIASKSSSIRRFKLSDADCMWGWSDFCRVVDLTFPILGDSGGGPNPVTVRINLILLQKNYDSPLGDEFLSENTTDDHPGIGDSSPVKRNEDSLGIEDSQPCKKSTTEAGDSGRVDNLKATEKFKAMIANLWENKYGWDVEMQCGDRVFKTHASILSARSSFFAREFASAPAGKKTFVVNAEVKPEILEALLEHCYKGVINLSKMIDKYFDLYVLAFRFEMRVLKDEVFVGITSADWMNSPYCTTQALKLAKEYPPELHSMRNLANYVAENLDELNRQPYFVQFKNQDIDENDGEFFTKLLYEA